MDGNPGGLAGSGAGHWPYHLAPFPAEDIVRIDMIVYNLGRGKWVREALGTTYMLNMRLALGSCEFEREWRRGDGSGQKCRGHAADCTSSPPTDPLPFPLVHSSPRPLIPSPSLSTEVMTVDYNHVSDDTHAYTVHVVENN